MEPKLQNEQNIDNILTKICPSDTSPVHKTEPDEGDVVVIDLPDRGPAKS